MAVTASEGEKFVEKEGGADEKRGVKEETKKESEAEEEKEEEEKEEKEEKKPMKRGRTMAVTASEGKKFVNKKPKTKSPRKSTRTDKKK